jgi:hypothetical protein
MHNISGRIAFFGIVVFIAIAPCSSAQPATGVMAYTVSMPQPSNHLFHVLLSVDGLKGEFHDFKMPAWHPGFYRLIDYAKSVSDFRAYAGNAVLPWEKTTKNT